MYFKNKYIKYKNKYLALKKQIGGAAAGKDDEVIANSYNMERRKRIREPEYKKPGAIKIAIDETPTRAEENTKAKRTKQDYSDTLQEDDDTLMSNSIQIIRDDSDIPLQEPIVIDHNYIKDILDKCKSKAYVSTKKLTKTERDDREKAYNRELALVTGFIFRVLSNEKMFVFVWKHRDCLDNEYLEIYDKYEKLIKNIPVNMNKLSATFRVICKHIYDLCESDPTRKSWWVRGFENIYKIINGRKTIQDGIEIIRNYGLLDIRNEYLSERLVITRIIDYDEYFLNLHKQNICQIYFQDILYKQLAIKNYEYYCFRVEQTQHYVNPNYISIIVQIKTATELKFLLHIKLLSRKFNSPHRNEVDLLKYHSDFNEQSQFKGYSNIQFSNSNYHRNNSYISKYCNNIQYQYSFIKILNPYIVSEQNYKLKYNQNSERVLRILYSAQAKTLTTPHINAPGVKQTTTEETIIDTMTVIGEHLIISSKLAKMFTINTVEETYNAVTKQSKYNDIKVHNKCFIEPDFLKKFLFYLSTNNNYYGLRILHRENCGGDQEFYDTFVNIENPNIKTIIDNHCHLFKDEKPPEHPDDIQYVEKLKLEKEWEFDMTSYERSPAYDFVKCE
jgi:hypothetical protein